MGLFKKARKFVKKIIPKEIRPFIPYIAAAFGPAGLAGTKFATLNPAFQKAILAGGTKFATDDEADLKDIGVTAALAAAPTALRSICRSYGSLIHKDINGYPLQNKVLERLHKQATQIVLT